MRIYTGTGDRGKTSLFSGERVSKHHIRIEAYGDLDEVNSLLGALDAALPAELAGGHALTEELRWIQGQLFSVSAWLATTPGTPMAASLETVDHDAAPRLERAIDRMTAELPELESFILPGGSPAAAWAHVARTACRRAERRVVHLSEELSEDAARAACGEVLVFINRLSDYLFVLARHLNRLTGHDDIPWKR